MYEDEHLSEADTRAKLVTPALHRAGWTEDLIKREDSAGKVEVIGGQARRRSGRMDYPLRVKATSDTQPVAVTLIEVKRNQLPTGHGLYHGKGYAAFERLNLKFVLSTNDYQFVAFDRQSGITTQPQPMADLPTPDNLRSSYEARVGFSLESPVAGPLLMRYSGGEAVRYYHQDAAIRSVLERVAHCELTGEAKRALLRNAFAGAS